MAQRETETEGSGTFAECGEVFRALSTMVDLALMLDRLGDYSLLARCYDAALQRLMP